MGIDRRRGVHGLGDRLLVDGTYLVRTYIDPTPGRSPSSSETCQRPYSPGQAARSTPAREAIAVLRRASWMKFRSTPEVQKAKETPVAGSAHAI